MLAVAVCVCVRSTSTSRAINEDVLWERSGPKRVALTERWWQLHNTELRSL
jgi:hypothetical protein